MDSNAMRVLTRILQLSPNGEAVIVDVQDFADGLRKAADPQKELLRIVGELDGAGLIAVKYADARQCCVSSLPKGRLAVEQNNQVHALNRRALFAGRTAKKLLLAVALLALLCGALGGVAATLIVLAITGGAA